MSEENVLGGFEAVAKLPQGRERVILLLTPKRLIMATGAKTGTRSMALSSLLGRLAVGAEPGGRKGELGRLGTMKPSEILAENEDNFDIGYDKVATMLVQPRDRWTLTVNLVTDREKILLEASATAVYGVKELMLSLLGPRLDFRA
jgi:hypothetical protein